VHAMWRDAGWKRWLNAALTPRGWRSTRARSRCAKALPQRLDRTLRDPGARRGLPGRDPEDRARHGDRGAGASGAAARRRAVRARAPRAAAPIRAGFTVSAGDGPDPGRYFVLGVLALGELRPRRADGEPDRFGAPLGARPKIHAQLAAPRCWRSPSSPCRWWSSRAAAHGAHRGDPPLRGSGAAGGGGLPPRRQPGGAAARPEWGGKSTFVQYFASAWCRAG
jgi:hypothetical protein